MEDRVRDAFGRIKVKPPFEVSPELVTHPPTEQQIDEVIFRLRQVLTDNELAALDDAQFASRVKQVWELVRWIHTDSYVTR
jgi:hypothetical protein